MQNHTKFDLSSFHRRISSTILVDIHSRRMSNNSELIGKLFEFIDRANEVYMGYFVKSFIISHEKLCNSVETGLRSVLDSSKAKIPSWLTANFVIYLRAFLVIPCLTFLSWDFKILSSLIVLLVDFGHFLGCAVSRFWLDVKQEREEDQLSKDKGTSSPSHSDDESFGR